MSETKYTPGPWKFLESFGRVETEHHVIAYIAGGVGSPHFNPDHAKANGQLVAAAPELYEAADAMLSAAADYFLDCGLDVLAERLRKHASVPIVSKADVIEGMIRAADNLAEVMRRCKP